MSEPSKAVFLSYASQDAEAAKRICEALREAGVEVWFDQNELVGGDAWDAKIRGQIKACALFVPVISAATQARREGYFRLEWKLAAQRTHMISERQAFLLPVVIDGTSDGAADVPEEFRAVQWTRLPAGEATPAFCARVTKLLSMPGATTDQGTSTSAPRNPPEKNATSPKPSRPWLLPVALGVAGLTAVALWQPWRAKETVAPASPPLATAPTKPLTEAQQLVAKARKILDDGDEMNRDIYPLAEELLKSAEKLDVTEASAWAAHAELSSMMYDKVIDASATRLEAMRSQAARAIKLAPDSRDAQIAVVEARLSSGMDMAGLKPELEELARRWPSDPRITRARMWVYMRLGDPEGAAQIGRPALELNPEDVRVAPDLINALLYMRRFAEAEKVASAFTSKRGAGRLWFFDTLFKLMWRGDRAAAAAAVARFPSWFQQEDRGAYVAWLCAFWDRKPDQALAVMQGFPRPFLSENAFAGPKAVLTALAHEQAGHVEAARADWRTVVRVSDSEIAGAPDSAAGYYWKAWASARLGDRAAAAEAAAQIVQRNLAGRSTFLANYTMAPLRVALGQPDEAFRDLKIADPKNAGLLQVRAALELNPMFDAIRSDPRFPALVAAALAPEVKPSAAPSVSLDEKAVAVLPFANLSGDKEQEYFSDGLTEEILNALARERDLRVPGRTSSFSFKGKNASAAEIASALNVSRLVEGSVQRSGTKVRIRVSLTRVADNASEELGTFTEELADIFALQDKVARAVVEKLTHRQTAGSVGALTKNPEAYDAYLRGRALQTRSVTSSEEAIPLFRKAVAVDPNLVLGWTRLAEVLIRPATLGRFVEPERVAAARAAITRALALQPDSPEALVARATFFPYVDADAVAAERDVQRAEALAPATAELRFMQWRLAAEAGRWEIAARRASESADLDPQNGGYLRSYAVYFSRRGDYVKADRLYASMIAVFNSSSTERLYRVTNRKRWRGAASALQLLDKISLDQDERELVRLQLLLCAGRTEEVRAKGAELIGSAAGQKWSAALADDFSNSVSGRFFDVVRWSGTPADVLRVSAAQRKLARDLLAQGSQADALYASLAQAEICLGNRAAAEEALGVIREHSLKIPFYARSTVYYGTVPWLYAQLGHRDEAIAILRQAQGEGFQWGYTLRDDPDLASLRDDPRFQELRQQAEAFAKAQPDPVDP